MQNDTPIIGVIAKNGMPYLTRALRSIEEQTYRNFRVVIQDAASTDGSLAAFQDFKERIDVPVDIVSETDDGIADGLNRVWKRAGNGVVAMLESDNFLLPDHLETGVKFFSKHQDYGILMTSQYIVDENDEIFQSYFAPGLDFIGTLSAQKVMPSGSSIFNKAVLGQELYYDTAPELGHVPDYEFWLRMAATGVKTWSTSKITFATRISDASGSCDYSSYDKYCASKIFALERFLDKQPEGVLRDHLLRMGRAGIYLWAASIVRDQGQDEEEAARFVRQALEAYPNYGPAQEYAHELNVFPPDRFEDIVFELDLRKLNRWASNKALKVRDGGREARIKTKKSSYEYQANFRPIAVQPHQNYCLDFDYRINKGGMGVMVTGVNDDDHVKHLYLDAEHNKGEKKVRMVFNSGTHSSLGVLFTNYCRLEPGTSEFEIKNVKILSESFQSPGE